MVLERELVDPLDQHGEPVPGPERGREQVATRTAAAEDEPGELHWREHVELLVAVLEAALEPAPQRRRPRAARREQDELLGPGGWGSVFHKPAEPGLDESRLAGAGRSENQQRTVGVGDRLTPGGKEAIQGERHV